MKSAFFKYAAAMMTAGAMAFAGDTLRAQGQETDAPRGTSQTAEAPLPGPHAPPGMGPIQPPPRQRTTPYPEVTEGEDVPLPHVFRFFQYLDFEVDRLDREGEGLREYQRRLRDQRAGGEIGQRVAERRGRMLELRRELLELEKEEFLDRVRQGTERAIAALEEHRQDIEEDAERPRSQRLAAALERMQERAEAFREAAEDYESAAELIRSMEAFRLGEFGSPRIDAMEREIEMLSRRIVRLRGELDRLEEEPDKGLGWRWHRRAEEDRPRAQQENGNRPRQNGNNPEARRPSTENE